MDFDELVRALGALDRRRVAVQMGTPDHDEVVVEATGVLRVESSPADYAAFTLERTSMKVIVSRAEFEDAQHQGRAAPLRFVTSGMQIVVAPT